MWVFVACSTIFSKSFVLMGRKSLWKSSYTMLHKLPIEKQIHLCFFTGVHPTTKRNRWNLHFRHSSECNSSLSLCGKSPVARICNTEQQVFIRTEWLQVFCKLFMKEWTDKKMQNCWKVFSILFVGPVKAILIVVQRLQIKRFKGEFRCIILDPVCNATALGFRNATYPSWN